MASCATELQLAVMVNNTIKSFPLVKILVRFEKRQGVAAEALDTEGRCPARGRGVSGPSACTRARYTRNSARN